MISLLVVLYWRAKGQLLHQPKSKASLPEVEEPTNMTVNSSRFLFISLAFSRKLSMGFTTSRGYLFLSLTFFLFLLFIVLLLQSLYENQTWQLRAWTHPSLSYLAPQISTTFAVLQIYHLRQLISNNNNNRKPHSYVNDSVISYYDVTVSAY